MGEARRGQGEGEARVREGGEGDARYPVSGMQAGPLRGRVRDAGTHLRNLILTSLCHRELDEEVGPRVRGEGPGPRPADCSLLHPAAPIASEPAWRSQSLPSCRSLALFAPSSDATQAHVKS